MRPVGRWVVLAWLVAIVALGSAVLSPVRHLMAQSAGVALWDLGSQPVSGTDWDFQGDFAIGAGAWESLTISNYGYCWVGPNDPRAGTAHAGAVYWFTELQPQPLSASGVPYTGTLQRGNMAGEVTITTTDDGTGPVTHIQVTITGSDLQFFQDNTLGVCLLGSS